MAGAGVEPPAPPSAAAARLAARGVRPRRISAKRSWPPGCGRFPAPPPPTAAAGEGEKGVDVRAAEAVAPVGVPPAAQIAAPPQQAQEVVAAPAAVPTAAQNGAPPQQGQGKVEVAAVPSAAQNGALPQKGQNKEEEDVAPAAPSPAERNGILPHALPQPGQEKVGEEGDGENSKAGSLINGTDAAWLDGQDGNRTVQVEVPVAAILDSGIDGADTSAQSSGNGDALFLVAEGRDGSGGVVMGEVAGDGDNKEMGNISVGIEIEGKVDIVQGSKKKRWLMSAVNPPPKRRAVSAVRKFPPGCGRAAITTDGSGVSALPPGCESGAASTIDSGVLEVSPVRTFPPGCGRVSVTTDGSAVLEVSPIRAYPSSGGMAAVTAIGSGNEKQMPSGATPVANGDASVMEALADEGSSKAHNNKTKGSISPREGKQAVLVGDDKVRSKVDGSSQKDICKTPMSRDIDTNTEGKRSDVAKMNVALLDNAKASGERNLQRKTLSTKKAPVRSNGNMKQDKFALKPKGDGIGKNTFPSSTESKHAKHVTTNRIEKNNMDLAADQIIVQALMAPDKCPWTQGKRSTASASKSLAPRKRLKGKDVAPSKKLPCKVASGELSNDETIDDNEDPNMEDDENSKALILYDENKEGKEFTANLLPSVPSRSHHGQFGDNNVDARRKVRKLLQKFQLICRKFMQLEENSSRNVGRIDLAAGKILKDDPTYVKPGAIVGNVPGVEVGDEFHFRVELSIVGLHRPYQAGIDASTINGVPVAISIVASGGYPDELSSSDELIYTGSGGKATGKKEAEDQKLERGNLALKNCIETKTPVRVIHGFKGQSRGEVAHSKGKQVSTFTYDGLYNVVKCWQESLKGLMVYKYRLLRIPGQPQLALHVVKVTKKSKVREGLLLPDISQGSERIPICVINTIDSSRPAPFKYVTKIIYPPWYKKEPPTGCDCTDGCSDSVKCACAVKNGGEIPYNFNGAIVEAKPLIYECGPSCRCPPTCHNRVSQHGVKIPLEIFKTSNRGWGVRSLSSIPSGSFICEYAGELLQDKEAEKRENDEYLFDIGHNYHDEELWEGLKSTPGLESSTSSSKAMEGFTIDAAECGNVGRFINHSCSPNLYAQNVLWDHDDVEKPHVMLFAVENIPPLQELTYHYNYTIGQVQDKNGEEKVKHCYCGSSECCGRLY